MKEYVRGLLGVILSIIFICLLIVFVGVSDFIRAISSADIKFSIICLLAGPTWLFMWSQTFRETANNLNIKLGRIHSFLLYSSVMFANNITPFAHLGGEPIAAGILSKSVNEDYDTSFGAISTASVIHFIPAIIFFCFGMILLLIIDTQALAELENVVIPFIIVSIIVCIGVILVIKFQSKFKDKIAILISKLFTYLSKLPGVENYNKEFARSKITGYFNSFSKLRDNKQVLIIGSIFSMIGLLAKAIGLWFGLIAVGYQIPILVPIIAFPISGMASLLPLPGGAGGIEAVLVSVVGILTIVPVVEITVAVILVRTSIFWTPIILGAVYTGYVSSS